MAQRTTLAELITAYLAAHPDLCYRQRARQKQFLRHWRWHLGAEPTVEHLTREWVAEFLRALGRLGIDREAVAGIGYVIRPLWRYFHKAGAIATPPPKQPLLPHDFRVMRPEHGSLLRYFDDVFVPETEHAASAFPNIRTACVLLGYALGRYARPDDLTAATIEHFRERAFKAGYGETRTTRYCNWLTQIARHRDPHSFPTRYDQPSVAKVLNSDEPGTLRHYFETVYSPHKLRGVKPGVVNNYRIAMRHFARFLGRPPVFTDLDDGIVTEFVYSLKLNAQTVNSYRSKLICFWNYAFRKRKVEFGPDVDALREFRVAPVALTMEQLGRVFDVARSYDRPAGGICGIPATDYWFSLVMALYDTGLRIGALRTAQMADLDLTEGNASVFIPGEHQKTGKYARRPLHHDTAAILHRMAEAAPDRELVWPWEMDGRYLYRFARQLFVDAGVDIPRKRFHLMRRTAATQVARRMGVEKARQYLQHTTVNTTLEHYIDEDQLDDEIARMCDLLPRPTLGKAVQS